MKRLIFSLVAMLCVCSIFAKDIKTLVVTTNPPMHCENCENKIKKGDLRFVKGVKKIETNIPEQRVTVEYDAEKTNPEKIEAAFEKIGYKVRVIDSAACDETSSAAKNCSGECHKKK